MGTLSLATKDFSFASSDVFKSWKLSNQLIKQAQKALRFLRVLSNNQIDNQALFMVGRDALTIAIEVAKTVGLAVDEVALQAQYQQLPIHDLHELAILVAI